jgi:hypothetical protein
MVWPRTEKTGFFRCAIGLPNRIEWQQVCASTLSVRFWEDSALTPNHSTSYRPSTDSDEPRADHAQYLASWLSVLKADKKAIFTAASKASEAAVFLAGRVNTQSFHWVLAHCKSLFALASTTALLHLSFFNSFATSIEDSNPQLS